MRFRYLATALAAALPAATVAQTPADSLVAAGDRAYAVRQAAAAFAEYEAAIAIDSMHYEALWKASRTAIDLAEYEPDRARQRALFETGEALARRAVAVNPRDAEGYFSMGRALGRVALTKGVRQRVRYATEVRANALRALEIDPDHPGAHHVLGRWNAEVRRLNGFERFFAKNLLGGRVFDEASWDNARLHLERAVASDPERLVHHLGLAEIYLDVNEETKAREQLQLVVTGPVRDYNDPHYQKEAAALLAKIE